MSRASSLAIKSGLGVIAPLGVDALRSLITDDPQLTEIIAGDFPLDDPLVCDITIEETPEYTSEVSMHKVEDGATVGDHIEHNPVRITVKGKITSTPAVFLSFLNSGDPAQDAFNRLHKWWKAKTLVDVVLGFDYYSNMAITSFVPGRNVNTGKALEFTMTLQELPFVESLTTSLVANIKPAASAKKLQAKKDMGVQKAKPPGKSLAKAAADFVSSMFGGN